MVEASVLLGKGDGLLVDLAHDAQQPGCGNDHRPCLVDVRLLQVDADPHVQVGGFERDPGRRIRTQGNALQDGLRALGRGDCRTVSNGVQQHLGRQRDLHLGSSA